MLPRGDGFPLCVLIVASHGKTSMFGCRESLLKLQLSSAL